MHIELCEKETHTNKRMTFFLKGLYRWRRFFACSWNFTFVVEWIQAIRNNAEITLLSSTWFFILNKQLLQLGSIFYCNPQKKRKEETNWFTNQLNTNSRWRVHVLCVIMTQCVRKLIWFTMKAVPSSWKHSSLWACLLQIFE